MKSYALALLLFCIGPIHAADPSYVAKRLSYCNELAGQLMNATSGDRSTAMRWVRLTSTYIDVLDNIGLSREEKIAFMDQAKNDVAAENARVRSSEHPIAAAYDNVEKSFLECNELVRPAKLR